MARMLCALFVPLVASLAMACVRSSQPPATPTTPPSPTPELLRFSRWDADSLPLEYCITNSNGYVPDAEFRGLVAEAFDAWGVASSYTGACAGDVIDQDFENQVGWGPLAGREDRYYEAGLTIRYAECDFRCDDGVSPLIAEADIIIDSDPPPYYRSSRCVLSVLVHEVGHLLGLEHLPAPAVMRTGGSECAVQVTPQDRTSLQVRYGTVGGSVAVRHDEVALVELITHQFELIRDEGWFALYPLYSPAFQDACPYEEFTADRNAASSELDPLLLGFEDLAIELHDDLAYVAYAYTYDGEPVLVVDASDPDYYRKIDGEWFDELDAHTTCD